VRTNEGRKPSRGKINSVATSSHTGNGGPGRGGTGREREGRGLRCTLNQTGRGGELGIVPQINVRKFFRPGRAQKPRPDTLRVPRGSHLSHQRCTGVPSRGRTGTTPRSEAPEVGLKPGRPHARRNLRRIPWTLEQALRTPHGGRRRKEKDAISSKEGKKKLGPIQQRTWLPSAEKKLKHRWGGDRTRLCFPRSGRKRKLAGKAK